MSARIQALIHSWLIFFWKPVIILSRRKLGAVLRCARTVLKHLLLAEVKQHMVHWSWTCLSGSTHWTFPLQALIDCPGVHRNGSMDPLHMDSIGLLRSLLFPLFPPRLSVEYSRMEGPLCREPRKVLKTSSLQLSFLQFWGTF